MPRNFFITGMPKAGKTTLLRKVIEKLRNKGLNVGGIVSPEEKHHGTRSAFYVEDIKSGKQAKLASVDGSGPKVSKYHVNIRGFERIALPAIERPSRFDVIIIDEIGRMEMKSNKFQDMIDKIFEHHVPVIAALHRDYVDRYAPEGEVFMLTETNRGAVMLELIRKVSAEDYSKPRPAKKKRTRRKKVAKKDKAKSKAAKKRAKRTSRTKTSRKDAVEEAPKRARKRGFFERVSDFLGF